MPAIANRYAKALVDVSFKLNHHEQVAQDLLQLEELLARTTSIELAGQVEFAQWPEYGPKALPMRFVAA